MCRLRQKRQPASKALSISVKNVNLRQKGGNFSYFCAAMDRGIYYFSGLAAFLYIGISVTVAAVRWYHMCRPYDRKPGYYYPGRAFYSLGYALTLVMLPYVFNPAGNDAWYLLKVFFLPCNLLFLSVVLLGYFGGVMKWRKWERWTFVTAVPVILALLAALVLAIWPGDQITGAYTLTADIVVYALGMLSTGVCVASAFTVRKWIRSFGKDEDDYSNPADFPVRFAVTSLSFILWSALILWVTILVNSRLLMGIVQIFLSAISVHLLIMVLHPQRTLMEVAQAGEDAKEEPEAGGPETVSEAEQPQQAYLKSLPDDKLYAILYAIQAVVVESEAYLDPHLTLQDVADRTGYNRSYVAGLIKSQYGGFYTFINNLRLDYAEQYQKAHPDATLNEVLSESGFGSRQAFYTAKSRLRQS